MVETGRIKWPRDVSFVYDPSEQYNDEKIAEMPLAEQFEIKYQRFRQLAHSQDRPGLMQFLSGQEGKNRVQGYQRRQTPADQKRRQQLIDQWYDDATADLAPHLRRNQPRTDNPPGSIPPAYDDDDDGGAPPDIPPDAPPDIPPAGGPPANEDEDGGVI